MNSVLTILTLAGAAAAQIVAGPVTMVPSSQVYATSTPSAGDNHVAASSSAPSYSSSAAPSDYTQPPKATDGGASDMPYSSFTNGGYKSMDCGYGHTKASDGSCQSMSWVSRTFFAAELLAWRI